MAIVLIIEDEPGVAQLLTRLVEMIGHDSIAAHDGSTGLFWAVEHHPDLIITDLSVPGQPSGLELVRALRAAKPATPMIITTGYGGEDFESTFAGDPAIHILSKPFDLFSAKELIRFILEPPPHT